MSEFDYVAVVAGYIVIFSMALVILLTALYLFYWVVLIPLHTSLMFNKAYKAHPKSNVWTNGYKSMRFKVVRMWFRGMKKPFQHYNRRIQGSLITIDYTGRFPRTTITK